MSAKRRYNVGVHKIPHAQRDIAHAVITDDDPSGFMDLIGADGPDDHEDFPLGASVTYSVELTDEEAERFRGASNLRYLHEDTVSEPVLGTVLIPSTQTMTWMEAPASDTVAWHGQDVPVAILDQGTTKAVRDYMGFTLVQRKVFGDDPSPAEIWPGSNHGCLVAPNGVPARGKLYDVLVTNSAGTAPTSSVVAAIRWVADQGVDIANYSYRSLVDDPTWSDAFTYALNKGLHIYVAAGNDSANRLGYPATYSTSFSNVHSVIAFDETTGLKADFSNYTSSATGCAPGVNVLSLSPTAQVVQWSGTSAATPNTASLCARLCTGATFTATQAAAALRAYTRNTGQPNIYQGGGAFSLDRALNALTAGIPNSTSGAPPLVAVRLADGQFGGVSDFINDCAQEIDWLGGTCEVRVINALAGQSANVDRLVAFDAVDIDRLGGMWTTLAPYFVTIRVAGSYSFLAQVRFRYPSTGSPYNTGTRSAQILLNSTDPASAAVASDRKPWSVDGEGVTLSMTGAARCNVGDRVYLNWRHTASAALDLCLDPQYGGTYLAVTRTGP